MAPKKNVHTCSHLSYPFLHCCGTAAARQKKKHQACDSPSRGWLRQPARLQRTWEWALSYDSTPMQTGYLCDMIGFSSLLLGSKRIPKKIKTDTFWYESKSQDQQKGSGGFEPKNDHPILGDDHSEATARDLRGDENSISHKKWPENLLVSRAFGKKHLVHWICRVS